MESKIFDSFSAANETDNIFDGFNGSLDELGTNGSIVEAEAGKADLRVSEGKSIVLDSITKDSDGGITNIDVAPNASLSVDGNENGPGVIEALGTLTTGDSSTIWFDKVVGTNCDTSVSIGKNGRATFEEGLDLMGASNTFTVGSSADVLVFCGLKNVSKIKLANGTADVPTYLYLTDSIVMSAQKNSITLGNHTVLRASELQNSDVNVGTVIKAGKNSQIYFDNMHYIEKITMASGSHFGVGGMSGDGLVPDHGTLSGTSNSNTFSFGADIKGVDTGDKHVHIGEVDMKGGKNTFSIGSGTVIYVDNAYNVTKDPVTKELIVTVAKVNDMFNITNLKLANGKSDNQTELHVSGSIIGSDYKNKITVGNYAVLTVQEKLAGFDSVKIGKNSAADILTAIEYVEKITVGAESNFYAGDISGTEESEKLSFGAKSTAEARYINFGDGKKDTLSIGKEASVRVNDRIIGVDVIKAGKSSRIIAGSINDAEEIVLDNVSGSWKNADIYDMQTDLISGTAELGGKVYGNEWDVYSFDCDDPGCDELTLSELPLDGQVALELYKHTDDGGFDKITIDDWSKTISGLDGRYSLLVGVEGADFTKDGADDYSFKATLA